MIFRIQICFVPWLAEAPACLEWYWYCLKNAGRTLASSPIPKYSKDHRKSQQYGRTNRAPDDGSNGEAPLQCCVLWLRMLDEWLEKSRFTHIEPMRWK